MKNTFGNSLSVTLFGESHGEAIGAVIDGISPGICVNKEFINKQLSRRRPSSPLDTARREPDNYRIVSGVFNGKTTGTPICIIIPNENTKSSDYTYGPARPSHADYAAYCKYHGFEDFRGGGHFSGRLTAALVAVGGILIPALERLGIKLGTHILKCGGVKDAAFGDGTAGNISDDISLLYNAAFPVIDHERGCEMAEQILKAKMIATASAASLRRQSWDCRQDSVSRILTALRVCFHTHCSESAGSRVLNSVSDSGVPTDGLRSLTIDCAW